MAQLIPAAAAQCEGSDREVEVGLNCVTEGDWTLKTKAIFYMAQLERERRTENL